MVAALSLTAWVVLAAAPPDAPPPPPPPPPRRVHAVVGVRQTAPQPRGIRGINVSGTVVVGTGVSMAPGPDEAAISKRSPTQLTVDAGFSHPDVRWLEISPAMMLELERGVSFGAALRLRAFVPTKRVQPYALVGIPAFLAPSTLLGAQALLGVAVNLHRHFALAAEFGPTVFFAGDDLTSGGTLTKLDGSVGIRVTF